MLRQFWCQSKEVGHDNEPLRTAISGYFKGVFAPGRDENPSTEPYLAAHYQLLAHAEAVSIYRKIIRVTQKQLSFHIDIDVCCFGAPKEKQGGEIGLVVDCEWAEPLTDDIEDKKAAARRLDFQLGWYLDPIFHGDYPESKRERLGDLLPKFSKENKELLRNSVDFVGLNHYTSRFVRKGTDKQNDYYRVQEVERIAEREGEEAIGPKAASTWLYIVPWGIRKVINHISQKYNNPPTYVTENGMDDEDDEISPLHVMLDGELRVSYYKGYLTAVAQAIK